MSRYGFSTQRTMNLNPLKLCIVYQLTTSSLFEINEMNEWNTKAESNWTESFINQQEFVRACVAYLFKFQLFTSSKNFSPYNYLLQNEIQWIIDLSSLTSGQDTTSTCSRRRTRKLTHWVCLKADGIIMAILGWFSCVTSPSNIRCNEPLHSTGTLHNGQAKDRMQYNEQQ